MVLLGRTEGEMTSFERLSTALRLGVPDRVPVALVSPVRGAKELGMPLPEYFRRAENVVEGQLRFTRRIGRDNVDAYFYFGLEAQAFGAEIIFAGEAPPTPGPPILRSPAAIDDLEELDPRTAAPLQEMLRTIELLAEKARGRWLVAGRAVGPCSLPIMLMGFGPWLDLLLMGSAKRRRRLLQITSQFCTAWANALLAAGADVVALVEPMASTSMLTREQAAKLVLPVVRRVVRNIRGPTILWSLAGIQGVVDLVPALGVQAVSTDPTDDLAEVKRIIGRRLALLGGLNDIAMLTWTTAEAEEQARRAIRTVLPSGKDGGFILSHQNEIPAGVDDEVLLAIVEAARKWGRYDGETPSPSK